MKRVKDESEDSSGKRITKVEDEIRKTKKRKLFQGSSYRSRDLLKDTDYSQYGSVAETIKDISLTRRKLMNVGPPIKGSNTVDKTESHTSNIKLEEIAPESKSNSGLVQTSVTIVIIDSDDEDVTPPMPAHKVDLETLDWSEEQIGDFEIKHERKSKSRGKRTMQAMKDDPKLVVDLDNLNWIEEDVYISETLKNGSHQDDDEEKMPQITEEFDVNNQVEDESQTYSSHGEGNDLDDSIASDGKATPGSELDGMWRELAVAIENFKGTSDFENSEHNTSNKEPTEDCEHLLILKDDIGYVCRICGFIQKGIHEIFEFQYKTPKSTRTYKYERRSKENKEHLESIGDYPEFSGNKIVTGFSVHPRHAKQMRSHQVEGFKFLARNLISEQPRGCILAHAPGSGKTFMIISFIQSFMATYPDVRPLIVLPKGILNTWKTEFLKWQVEDILLYDLYSAGAEGRSQQLEVLRKWVKERSILFLGYMQFSSIVSEVGNSETVTLCQDILSKVPTILILDEGHTPRNKETGIADSISRVQTPRKVVLSGTLYQNNVQEVFNILDLVHPKFLQSDMAKAVAKRIMSRVAMGSVRRITNGNAAAAFYDLVEQTLQGEDLNTKVHVINDLRDMTKDILHYYKGDFLDDLPGLEDFTVKLNLTPRQRTLTKKLKEIAFIKRNSVGSVIYLHPELKEFIDNNQGNKEKQTALMDATIDGLIKQVDIREGIKAVFFLKVLKLCQRTDEKLLVFSQYLLPLKFLERLTCNEMNWSLNREIFTITGDASAELRERSMNQFNNSESAKVFFGSIKACGEGISLVGASRIIILDVHLNPSVSRQALGRAFRPGQKKKVYVYRLIASGSPEEDDHDTCLRKELISKMWFEWNQHSNVEDFRLKEVDIDDCGDGILESPHIQVDVKALYKR